jgi:HD-GYP domain-containing protein (c-di-GMP phosphodiesterase class II)
MGKISIFAQIIAVADTFHAMTSERVYRSKESPFKVIDMFKEYEFGKFDIKVVEALVQLVAGLPIGTTIELSNMEHANIMFVNRFAPTRPLVKLANTGEIIDLSKHRNLYISQVIPK